MNIIVIGGGIIGISCALDLQEAGNLGTIGEGASCASCGYIAVSEVVPLARPNTLMNIPSWLIEPLSPLSLRPSSVLTILPWFIKFISNATMLRVKQISLDIATINSQALSEMPGYNRTMLYDMVEKKKQTWLKSPECNLQEIFSYIRETNKLRLPQIEAIETYFFLKICAENKPLSELFFEGFFLMPEDYVELEKLPISNNCRIFLRENKDAMSLYQFAQNNNINVLRKEIETNYSGINYQQVINKLFYEISYPDYLMSLPMGAGKTYLIAAIIYLDLYFSQDTSNQGFARNFLILIPNALKSSIGPSLANIENFEPSWVLPKVTAEKLKRNLKFEVLDEKRRAKRTMQTNNPNAVKVSQAIYSRFNHIFVVNAEKIILDKSESGEQDLTGMEAKNREENELRYCLSQLPDLGIFIDEVHHVNISNKNEIKLRKVVNGWHEDNDSDISYVLGFSGTPYLRLANTVKVNDYTSFKTKHITNTVYHYPLYDAVELFLKRPRIMIASGNSRDEIISKGVKDFINEFGNKKYNNGTIAKMVIYSPSIKVLEDNVYPLLTNKLKINETEILRYHKGNKEYHLPKSNELSFRSLDLPQSPHKFILLVGVGREGWDCRSLTGVILAQEGDCSNNMVLQTCCRCLREVDGDDEEALIWLNHKNSTYLDQQLKQEQHTSIEELNLVRPNQSDTMQIKSRVEYLNLPRLSYYQMKIKYTNIAVEKDPNTKNKLKKISLEINTPRYKRYITTSKSDLTSINKGVKEMETIIKGDYAVFTQWLQQLSKESFNLVSVIQLLHYKKDLKLIFQSITIKEDNANYWDNVFLLKEINSAIRLSFHKKRKLKSEECHDEISCDLIDIEELPYVAKDLSTLYPSAEESERIIEYDIQDIKGDEIKKHLLDNFNNKLNTWKEKDLLNEELPQETSESSLAVLQKERSFHYLPHNFSQSNFEKTFLEEALKMKVLKEQGLEIYYNGDRKFNGLSIECYTQNQGRGMWHRVGNYTTDFLIIKRDKENKFSKVLIIETKGQGFRHIPDFEYRRKFVDEEFVRKNNEFFNYEKFAFLCLVDNRDIEDNIQELEEKIGGFFI